MRRIVYATLLAAFLAGLVFWGSFLAWLVNQPSDLAVVAGVTALVLTGGVSAIVIEKLFKGVVR